MNLIFSEILNHYSKTKPKNCLKLSLFVLISLSNVLIGGPEIENVKLVYPYCNYCNFLNKIIDSA